MANRYLQQFYFSFVKKLTAVKGYVDIAADASVSASSVVGGVVTKTGTGEYTLTLTDKYNAIVNANLTLQAATAVDLVPQIVSQDVSGAKTVVFKLLTGATATNPAAVCRVYINLEMRNSSVAI